MSDTIDISNIVGFHEVSEMLGVSKQRVHMLRMRGDFPEPISVLAATPIWDSSVIRQYDQTRRRKPGAPKKQTQDA